MGFRGIIRWINNKRAFNRNFPGLSRNAKWFDEKETTCTGWVSLSDIVSGRCGDARIKVE